MTPVIPCSVSNTSFIPGTTIATRTNRCFSRYNFSGQPTKQSFSSQRFLITLPRSNTLFPPLKNRCSPHHFSRTQRVSATGVDAAVEEKDSPAVEEKNSPAVDEASAGPSEEVETKPSVSATATPARTRQGRRSEMPPVKNEDLVPGATFTGKVRSIQPFGAFIDIGAFTEGLVHVSRMSEGFVKDVNAVVSLGQEVQVRVVEVDTERRRISLSMRDDDGGDKKKDADDSSSKPRSGNASKPGQRREGFKKTSKFVKGQDLVGTVKNLGRSGSFISLPDGEEGFLPMAEEADSGFASVMGKSSLEVGQEVNVRVLRIARGTVTLTMKKDEGAVKREKVMTHGVVHTATNPFVIAFRRNNDIASFLDEREAEEKQKTVDQAVAESEASSGVQAEEETSTESAESVSDTVDDLEDEKEESVSTENVAESAIVEEASTESSSEELVVEAQTEDSSAKEVAVVKEVPVEDPVEVPVNEEKVEASAPEGNGSVTGSSEVPDESPPQGSVSKAISPALVKQLREATGAGMMDCKNALSETGGDMEKAQEYLRKKGLASADKKSSRATAEGRIGSYIHDSRIGVLIEVNCETDFVSRGDIFRELVDDLAMQVAACPQVEYLSTDDVPKETVEREKELEMQKEDLLSKPEQIRSKIVEGRVSKRLGDLALLEQPYIKNDKMVVKDWVKQTIATIGENIKVRRFVKFNLGEGLEKKSQDFAAEVAAQTAAKPAPASDEEKPAAVEAEKPVEPVEKAPAVAVSATLVKQLREETGAGMMDCKKALSETGGDLAKAQEYLRKKGLSSADKKSSRLAAEGRIGSYIHDSRIGVLIEVNCETDFVGRSENFKELVDDLAMQVAACPQVQYVSIEDIPASMVTKEKEIEMQREDLQSKPENIREKIVEGRISKRLGELALLEQPFIKNDSILVKDLVKQTVATLGENIKVRRFARFTLGEEIETETSNMEPET